jgi:hypothetical protein
MVRYLNIDMNKGGLIKEETEIALSTLDQQVNRYTKGVAVRCPHCQHEHVVMLEEQP